MVEEWRGCMVHVLLDDGLGVLVVGVAWVPMERRMRLKEAALADIHVTSLPDCETIEISVGCGCGCCNNKKRQELSATLPPSRAGAAYNFWRRIAQSGQSPVELGNDIPR